MMSSQQLSEFADKICPMHVIIDASGKITSVGPTMRKLRPDFRWDGDDFFSIFSMSRPRWVRTVDDMLRSAGAKLHMNFASDPQTGLKGVLAPLPEGGGFLNMSFGISVLEAVRDYDLTSADFSPTDLTIEMLYLVEAKSAAMEASRQLNMRLQGAKIAAEEQAFTDTLTGLKNRRALDFVLKRQIDSGREFALMHVDLDYFKQVNDTMGHAAGDAVLQRVAQVLVECTREVDTAARVGGDEFIMLLDGLTDVATLERIASRLITMLENPVPFEGKMCQISASVGTALAQDAVPRDAQTLIHQADLALYAAKKAGRGCHLFYQPDMEMTGL